MSKWDMETKIAEEGSPLTDEARLAFLEEFALAEDLGTKHGLVQRKFVPGTADFWFYDSVCVLLELQTLTEAEDPVKDTEAWGVLSEKKTQLETAEQQLNAAGCWKRMQRLQRRRLLLELELNYRLKKPSTDIASVTQQLTTALQINHLDPEPAGVINNMTNTPFPTTLSEELLDIDKIIEGKLTLLKFDSARASSLERILQDLDVYAREKTFQKVLLWDGSDDERWELLEVFLDDYAFEYTDIPGYLDLIVKDVARSKTPYEEWRFNFRAAHQNLSFPQLVACAQRAPECFCNNPQFALRGIQLLRATAQVGISQSFDLRDGVQHTKELQHIAEYLEFLTKFTPTAVESIRVGIYYRKLELLLVTCCAHPEVANELLNCLVEYVAAAGSNLLRSLSYVGECGFQQVSQISHEKIIQRSVERIWACELDENAVMSVLDGHLDRTFLDTQHALTMIKVSKGNFSLWAAKLPDKGQELSRQASSSELTFCESNPTYFLPEDPLRIHVRTRNVKTLTAHLYEIKTMEYYSRLRREIKGNICLDGLLPTEEQVIDLSHLSAWQEARVPINFLATQTRSCYEDEINRRGVYVVEIFEKGMTCRAILRRGFLRYVERITSQGHEFTVLNENGNLIRDARALVLNLKSGGSKAQLGREYIAGENGTILIPFRHSNEVASGDKFAISFSHGLFGNFHGSFNYLAELFAVSVDMHIDTEQLVPGAIAQLVARPRLLVAGIATGESLDLFVDVKLVIEFNIVNTSNVGVSSHKEFQSFMSMREIMDNPPRFEIPMDAEGFSVTLFARVSRPNLGQDVGLVEISELPQVSDSKRFDVQRVNNFSYTYTPHLARTALEPGDPRSPSEFCVLALGHNGESVADVPMTFCFRQVHSTKLVETNLQADSTGKIKLGQLQDITKIIVEFGVDSCSWELPNLRSYRPQIVNCSLGEPVEIPIPFAYSNHVEGWMKEKMVVVCEVVDIVLQNASQISQIKIVNNKWNQPVSLTVRIGRAGTYLLYIRPLNLKYPITVFEKKNTEVSVPLGLIIQPTQVLLATRTLPLMICSQELKTEGDKKVLEIRLRNASINSTQVVLSLKHFQDTCKHKVSEVIVADGLTTVSSSGAQLPKLSFNSGPLENDFLKVRKISDEYAYILQRRALTSNQNLLHLLSSSTLSKPSLLQNPHVVNQSDMEVVNVRDGDKVTGFKSVVTQDIQSGGHVMRKRKLANQRARRSSPMHAECASPSISFLGQQSQLIASSAVDVDGIVRIDLSALTFFSSETGSFEVCTVVIDRESGYACTQELVMSVPSQRGALTIPKRDIRLSAEEALSPSDHYQQVDSHECVRAGDVKTLPRSFSTKYALYENLESIIRLWPTLTSGSDKLADKLNGWWRLSGCEKTQFYYANACDDFNFYLFQKDPEFFTHHARPLIASKICKTLIDYYVLCDEASLRRFYLDPATFQRLGCVEKLLLAERMTNVEERYRICRAVVHEIESNYPSGCSSTTLANVFNTVLSQGQVDPTGAVSSSDQAPAPESGGLFGSAPGVFACASVGFGSALSPAYSPQDTDYDAIHTTTCGGSSLLPKRASFCSSMERETTETTGIELSALRDYDNDFGVRSLDSESNESEEEMEGADADDDSREENKKRKARHEMPYIPPGKVRKLQEKRYFAEQYPALSGRNMFWKEYAEHIMRSQDVSGRSNGFISSYFPEAMGSITEGLFALAVLDLDVETKPTEVKLASSVGTHVVLSPASDVILYRRSIGPAQGSPTANTVLILKQTIRDENGDDASELVVNTIYTEIVTLSNIGSEGLGNVNLLLQIPQGSLPMRSHGFYTKNEITYIKPNHTQEFKFSFYFPQEGVFDQYPARASVGDVAVAWPRLQVESSSLKVVRSATRVNLASWNDVSARGTLEEVVHFMQTVKPGVNVDYGKLFWRCHDESFFLELVDYLRGKMIFVTGVWKYGLLHRDEVTMKEYFASSNALAESIGSGFHSSFVDEAKLYRSERFLSAFECFDHCEFGPFLTRRVHPVTGEVDAQVMWGLGTPTKASGKRTLNAEAREYFGGLCQRVGMRTHMDGEHLLAMAFYMILFDRIGHALEIFSRLGNLSPLQKRGIDSTVQYAYLDAFLDFFRSSGETGRSFEVARRVISQYSKHPQPRWRMRFQNMQAFVDEYDTFEVHRLNRLQQMEMVDSPMEQPNQITAGKTVRGGQVKLEATVSAGVVTLESLSLVKCELSFYPIDVELMFSTEPFNTFSDSAASASSLLLIEPRQRLTVDINTIPSSEGLTKTTVPILGELAATQMMIRIREIQSSRTVSSAAPPIDLIRPYFNSSLNVEIITQCGMLQVLHDGLPVRSCYIKVYAKASPGGRAHTKTEFYKDGYTDLLGKFDYIGINGDLISSVEKFSILILHEKLGASVEQVDPPVLASSVGDYSNQQECEMLLY